MGVGKKRLGAEQIVNLLRQIEVMQAGARASRRRASRRGSPNRPITVGAKPTGAWNWIRPSGSRSWRPRTPGWSAWWRTWRWTRPCSRRSPREIS